MHSYHFKIRKFHHIIFNGVFLTSFNASVINADACITSCRGVYDSLVGDKSIWLALLRHIAIEVIKVNGTEFCIDLVENSNRIENGEHMVINMAAFYNVLALSRDCGRSF
jgi:hypothetical protein